MAVAQRELQHIAGTGSYTRTYTYGGTDNRLQSTTVDIAAPTVYIYNYDARGNMTSMPHLSIMNWNASNELSSIESGDATHYQYSGGQRMRKYTDKGAIKDERIYFGNFEIYRKFTGTPLAIDIERSTVHISDDTGRIAMLEVLNEDYGDDGSEAILSRYIYSNHLQSASLELDENADIISYEEYHPYGTTAYQALSGTINAIAKRYRYTGKERDEESGLYYHGARYYVPWLCRWCASDPLENEFSGRSPYCYGDNHPINFNDPDGKQEQTQVNQQWHPPLKEKENVSKEWDASIESVFGSEYIPYQESLTEIVITGKAAPKAKPAITNEKANEIVQTSPSLININELLHPTSGSQSLPFKLPHLPAMETATQPNIKTKKNRNKNRKDDTETNIINMMSDPETVEALKYASAKTGVALADLMTMAIIESHGDKNIGTNKHGYVGLMQLGKPAIDDITPNHPEITMNSITNDVKMNALAGALYWKRNENSLRKYNIPSNLFNQYMAHQQGARGFSRLLKQLRIDPNAPLTEKQKPNMPGDYFKKHAGEKVTQQMFYNAWVEKLGRFENKVKAYLLNH
ncbi:MAG: hypothetical protein EOP48_15185 [Sphingobacteriales bacterium]|nr:MAG: hypothetical protein EOP48_15185 [Sphingobacteriales bacterium]